MLRASTHYSHRMSNNDMAKMQCACLYSSQGSRALSYFCGPFFLTRGSGTYSHRLILWPLNDKGHNKSRISTVAESRL